MNYTHKGKIDVIYIDPPYNTGNKDFIFNDQYVDREDAYRHSKWLSFIERRLILSRTILKNDGVIFISIGIDEVAQLRVLADEIFGEKNCLGWVVRRAKTTSFRGNFFAPRIDYILVYAKNSSLVKKFRDEVDPNQYKKIETEGERKGKYYGDDTAFYLSTLETRPNQRYYIKCPDGELVIPPGTTKPSDILDGAKANPKNGDGVWRWEVNQYLQKKNYLVFKKTKTSPLLNQYGKQAKWNIYTKIYFKDKKDNANIPTELLLNFINRAGTQELKQLDLDINFEFPKPTSLVRALIKYTDKEKDIKILDFFSGSGTTGQAVLALNKEDGGNRQFILCTNNELNGAGSELIKENPHEDKEKFGICQRVCYPRIERVIKGYKNNKNEKIEGLGGNLKYFKTSFVPADSTDKNKVALTEKATEMLCIKEDTFEEVKSTKQYKIFRNKKRYTGIIFDYQAIGDFKKEIVKIDGKFNLYIFSLGDDTFDEEFEDIKKKVKLSPIPEAILRVYRRIFK